jgi:hypothetical protein
MPADDGLWFHDDEDVGPAGPDTAKGGPEEPVDRVQGRLRSLALEHCDLVSQGKYLQGGVATRTEEDSDCDQERKDEFGHELTVVTWRNAALPVERTLRPLILRRDEVVSTDRFSELPNHDADYDQDD